MNEQETNVDAASRDDTEPGRDPPSGGTLDTDLLPVKLVFLAGETEIALRDLRRVMPGYVFDLGRPVDRHVEVRANGRRIGVGELVEIDRRVGVRMLKCEP